MKCRLKPAAPGRGGVAGRAKAANVVVEAPKSDGSDNAKGTRESEDSSVEDILRKEVSAFSRRMLAPDQLVARKIPWESSEDQ